MVRKRKAVHVEQTRRVLQAAAVEAFGRSGAYVTWDLVMQRVNMVDSEHFIFGRVPGGVRVDSRG